MSISNLRSLNGQVLVEPFKKEEKKTTAGIIIPDINTKASRNRVDKATVILVEDTILIKKGEIVYYAPGSGSEVILEDGKTYLIIPVTQLKLVREPEPAV